MIAVNLLPLKQIRETMEDLENVPKQTGSAILDFDGKVMKVSQLGMNSQELSPAEKLRLRDSFR